MYVFCDSRTRPMFFWKDMKEGRTSPSVYLAEVISPYGSDTSVLEESRMDGLAFFSRHETRRSQTKNIQSKNKTSAYWKYVGEHFGQLLIHLSV